MSRGPPLLCLRICVCLRFFLKTELHVSVFPEGARQQETQDSDATTNTALTERGHTVRQRGAPLTGNLEDLAPQFAVCLKRGFQLASPSEEQPNKNLNNKNSFKTMLIRRAHIP